MNEERRGVSWLFRFCEKGVCFAIKRSLGFSHVPILISSWRSSSTKIERLLTLEMILCDFSTLEVSRAFKLLGFPETRLISCSRQLPDVELVPPRFSTNKQNSIVQVLFLKSYVDWNREKQRAFYDELSNRKDSVDQWETCVPSPRP